MTKQEILHLIENLAGYQVFYEDLLREIYGDPSILDSIECENPQTDLDVVLLLEYCNCTSLISKSNTLSIYKNRSHSI